MAVGKELGLEEVVGEEVKAVLRREMSNEHFNHRVIWGASKLGLGQSLEEQGFVYLTEHLAFKKLSGLRYKGIDGESRSLGSLGIAVSVDDRGSENKSVALMVDAVWDMGINVDVKRMLVVDEIKDLLRQQLRKEEWVKVLKIKLYGVEVDWLDDAGKAGTVGVRCWIVLGRADIDNILNSERLMLTK